MSLIQRLKKFISKLFSRGEPNTSNEIVVVGPEEDEEDSVQIKENEKIKVKNIIFEKLNSLEQYIKMFSLDFPNEYNSFLSSINEQKRLYEEELSNFLGAFSGNLSFSIDPEYENKRLTLVYELEGKIKDFVNYTVSYSVYKNKFSKLNYRLCLFYNTLVNSPITAETIRRQFTFAYSSLQSLYDEAKNTIFFAKDSRKKEELLSHVMYAEYILFKGLVRSKDVQNLGEYKDNCSEFYKLFTDSDYNNLIFKFFVEDLEQYQSFINANLKNYPMYKQIISHCESLQRKLASYENSLGDNNYIYELISFENTCSRLAKSNNVKLNILTPCLLNISPTVDDIVSVKNTAISALNLIDKQNAKILLKVMSNFKHDISWREFYFLCKIFELYADIMNIANIHIFSSIKANFTKYENGYNEYSSQYINEKKQKILQSSSTTKKYILLLTIERKDFTSIYATLNKLNLDFVILGNEVFLNYAYFKGFKNLDSNFGNYVTL